MRILHACSIALLLCALLPVAKAQTDVTDARIPTIWIAPDQGAQPIRLSSLDIQIRMHGFVARSTLELSFDNPNDRVLEGEFVFPLAAGQSVAGYALEVNGAMREGVVVDKQTARVAFESTTRQQIDPGLAELTAGNVFRTRLYPIPARGSKRVRLHIESILDDTGSAWRYRLPMQFAEPVARFHVRAESLLASAAPLLDKVSGDPELKFEKVASAWVAELTRENVRPQKELAFLIPKTGGNGAALIEAIDAIDPAWRSVIAQVDSGLPTRPAKLAKPVRIALFVDASASARDRDQAREMAALRTYLQTLSNSEILLIAFRNDADPAQRLRVRDGNADAVVTAIAALPLDGGSSYGAIDLRGIGAIDQVLIIGDGLSNFGSADAHLIDDNGKAPAVFVLHAAQRADHAQLARLARSGGGQLIDLTTTSAAQASTQLQQRGWRLLGSEVGAGECRDVTVTAPMRVDATVTVSARCRGKSEWVLRFGDGDSKDVVRKLVLGRGDAVSGAVADSVHRLWAQARIDQLHAETKPDIAAITAIAKRHGVVTAHTSLLVLDRIEDYVRYRVEPMEADLRVEYQRQLALQPKQTIDPALSARLDTLAQRWRAFRDYHAANYRGIESLLGEMATTELRAWSNSEVPAWRSGRSEAETLKKRADELVARWPQAGAEPTSRAEWQRESARLVFALEALRAQRERLPVVAKPAANDNANEDGVSELQSVQVTGSRIDADEERAAPRYARAQESLATPPPAPSTQADAEYAAASADAPAIAPPEAANSAIGGHAAASASALTAQIELSGWNPDTPYLAAIRVAKDPYKAYLIERENNGKTPAFYLDVADHLRDHAKSPRLALRVLSNLAELDTENTALVRVLAYRLGQWDRYDLAVPQFERALTQRAEEPQSYRDLALALARATKPDTQRAIALLWQVATRAWDGRFPDIELIALHELNDVRVSAADAASIDLAALGIDERFVDPVAVGLRVVLSWDADSTDIDLWVTDPSGDKAWYSTPNTRTGGHVSRDFTGGYGPEVYTIRTPLPGTYIVHANYFGDRRQSLTGPVTVQLEFQTRFGSAGGKRAAVTRRLEGGSETIEIGRFKVGE